MSYLDTARQVVAELHGNTAAIKATEATEVPQAPLSSHMSLMSQGRVDDADLLARCKTACEGLSLWPQELAANLSPPDREAILSGDPAELGALRLMAEGLSQRLRTGALPPHLHEAYERLRKQLAEHPGLRFACETLTPDADPVLVAVCVRGAGFATLRIARERYDEGKLLELVHRWNTSTEGQNDA